MSTHRAFFDHVDKLGLVGRLAVPENKGRIEWPRSEHSDTPCHMHQAVSLHPARRVRCIVISASTGSIRPRWETRRCGPGLRHTERAVPRIRISLRRRNHAVRRAGPERPMFNDHLVLATNGWVMLKLFQLGLELQTRTPRVLAEIHKAFLLQFQPQA